MDKNILHSAEHLDMNNGLLTKKKKKCRGNRKAQHLRRRIRRYQEKMNNNNNNDIINSNYPVNQNIIPHNEDNNFHQGQLQDECQVWWQFI